MTELLNKYPDKKDFIEKRINQLKSRGLSDENLAISLVKKELKGNEYRENQIKKLWRL